MGERHVTNWHHCPKCDKPVDPVRWPKRIIVNTTGEQNTVEWFYRCPNCKTEVEIRSGED